MTQFHLSPDGLRATSATILEYRSEFVASPTIGAVDGSKFYFMANTQLDNSKDGKIVDSNKSESVGIGENLKKTNQGDIASMPMIQTPCIS